MTSTLISTESILAVHDQRIATVEKAVDAAHDEAKTTGEKVDKLRTENNAWQQKLLFYVIAVLVSSLGGLLSALAGLLLLYMKKG